MHIHQTLSALHGAFLLPIEMGIRPLRTFLLELFHFLFLWLLIFVSMGYTWGPFVSNRAWVPVPTIMW